MSPLGRRIARRRSGAYVLRLPSAERALVGRLVDQLRDVLLVGTDDPVTRRLFPTAYNEDAEKDREYQQLVRDDLLAGRLRALATVDETIEADELDEDQLTGWLTALNDLRLVLGTRLDVDEELAPLEADDPEAPAYAVYEYLGYLLGEAVDALAGGLPEATDDSP